jgi:hypothetical protein
MKHDDPNEANNLFRVAREKDSVRVARPLARQEYMQQYNADKHREVEQAIVEERKERDANMRRQFEQHRHEDSNPMNIHEKIGIERVIQDLREENTQQFAKHIHFNERGHFGDLEESIGIELDSNTIARLPNLISNVFSLNK